MSGYFEIVESVHPDPCDLGAECNYMDVIVMDLDGSLVDTSPAQDYMTRKPKNFAAFQHFAMNDALPNVWVLHSLEHHVRFHRMIAFVTGREARLAEATKAWLRRHGALPPRYSLAMRADGDRRSDDVVKPELLRYLMTQWTRGATPVVAYEDRPRVMRAWERLNVPVVPVPGWPEGQD